MADQGRKSPPFLICYWLPTHPTRKGDVLGHGKEGSVSWRTESLPVTKKRHLLSDFEWPLSHAHAHLTQQDKKEKCGTFPLKGATAIATKYKGAKLSPRLVSRASAPRPILACQSMARLFIAYPQTRNFVLQSRLPTERITFLRIVRKIDVIGMAWQHSIRSGWIHR